MSLDDRNRRYQVSPAERLHDLQAPRMPTLQPIATAPRDGTYILLFGPSGYIHTPFRCEVCKYDANHRPLAPWITSEDEAWADGGEAPTYWLPLPKKPAPVLD
jgi:hypothetical protein